MSNEKRRVLFHRSWTKFNGGTSGGQLKVRDAYEHILDSHLFEPKVYFGKETIWYENPGNVWLKFRDAALDSWLIQKTDILFFSGTDWQILTPDERKSPPVPILNIAQPRHTRREDKRHEYLQHPAIRIAKSSIGKKILEDFGVNGPVYFIPDAIDFNILPEPNPNPEYDILIVALKNEDLGKKLFKKLQWYNWLRGGRLKIALQVPPKLPTRADFLNLVNSARIVAYLPLTESEGAEGFYLPALEGMVMRKLVICPFAVGNVDFCIPDVTCLQPEYTLGAIFDAIIKALDMSPHAVKYVLDHATKTTLNHTLAVEQERLLELLHHADDIWNDTFAKNSYKNGS
jgi:hypothetical protein